MKMQDISRLLTIFLMKIQNLLNQAFMNLKKQKIRTNNYLNQNNQINN